VKSRYILVLLLLLAGISKGSLSAVFNQSFLFETSTGIEVEVQYMHRDDSYTFLVLNKRNLDVNSLLLDLVNTAQNQQHYEYIQIGAPCPGCLIESNPSFIANKNLELETLEAQRIDTNRVAKKINRIDGMVKSAKNIFEGAVAGIAGTQGSQVIDNFDAASSPGNPTILVFNNGDYGPLTLCVVSEGNCNSVPEIKFVKVSNGYDFEFLNPEIGTPEFEFDSAILAAMNVAAESMQSSGFTISCRIVFTGEHGNLRAQQVCYARK
jgi:hypothetical protein